ncbi:MAG: EamA family transporter, partial [Bacteroidota bacterium]
TSANNILPAVSKRVVTNKNGGITSMTIMLALVVLLGQWKMPSRVQWRNVVVSSLLFLGVGLTAVVWAEQYIDSGITALVVALEPLTVVLVMWGWDRQMPKWSSFVGVLLGIVGMYLLVTQQEIVASWDDWMGILAIVVAILCWAFGSNYITKNDLPDNKLLTASLQMLVSGLVILPLSVWHGDLSTFDWQQMNGEILYAWLFLVFFGSILAYSAFNYLLKKTTPDKVATSTYIHPLVAIFLGWYFRDEFISTQTLLAASIMLVGVFFINSNFGKTSDEHADSSEATGLKVIKSASGRKN